MNYPDLPRWALQGWIPNPCCKVVAIGSSSELRLPNQAHGDQHAHVPARGDHSWVVWRALDPAHSVAVARKNEQRLPSRACTEVKSPDRLVHRTCYHLRATTTPQIDPRERTAYTHSLYR